MQTGEVIACGFFVAGGDTTKMLDGIEEPFNEIALAVYREVAVAFDLPVRFRRDHRLDGPHLKALDEGVAVISLVAKHCSGLNLSREGFCLCDIVRLPPGEADRKRVSQSIDYGVNFSRQAAARAAYGLILSPFLRAPALC